ncbi:MAG TPA: DMT family transporter, partial [Alphaproteobacteria bacterium]|nr:DMT family transporter [Alphaproteobacteria bacterium]
MTAIAGELGDASTRRGILWMLTAIALFVTMDTVAKYLTQSYPVPQVVWGRYVFHVVLLALVLNRRLAGVIRTRRLGLQLVRSLMLLGTTAFFYAGLRFIPLVDASAIMFLTPILVTALSVPFLGEQVGPRRWAGVAIGFIGAMIVIRPGTGMMAAAALLPLLAALFNAVYHLSTRILSRSDAPMTTLFYSAAVGAVLSSAFLPFYWTAPDAAGWMLMAMLGLLGGTSHFALIKAFQAAPPAAVAPFNYTSILWATLFGFLLFDELPDRFT